MDQGVGRSLITPDPSRWDLRPVLTWTETSSPANRGVLPQRVVSAGLKWGRTRERSRPDVPTCERSTPRPGARGRCLRTPTGGTVERTSTPTRVRGSRKGGLR